MLTKEELPDCPVATTVRLVGNKWKLLIIRNLIYHGKQRFTDFLRSIPAISKKVLTDNLRALEEDGLVERQVFAEVPPRVEYTLSSLGSSLKPILSALIFRLQSKSTRFPAKKPQKSEKLHFTSRFSAVCIVLCVT